MRDNFFMNSMGMTYLNARASGLSSAESCNVVREEFNKPDLSDATIRSYASKAAQHGRVIRLPQREPKRVGIMIHKSFHILQQIWDEFEKEAKKKGLGYSDLMNVILGKRYRKVAK